MTWRAMRLTWREKLRSSPAPAVGLDSILDERWPARGRPGDYQPKRRFATGVSEGDRGPGPAGVPVELDVRDHDSIQRMVEAAIAHYGKIDILVNNAGCNVRKPALDVTWDDWNLMLDTNLRGTFFVSQAVARHMIPRKYGRIINIGSVTCVAGYAGLGPYGASRGGVKQLTMSLADDWGVHGITVNCLAPGWFKTAQNAVMYENQEWVEYLCDRIPLKRPGQPNDLDGAVVFLASDASAIHHRPDAAGGRRHLHRRHAARLPRSNS